MNLAVAILGIIQIIIRVFGPSMARFAEAEVEKFRAKNPNHPNVAAGLDRMKAIILALVHEAERADFGELVGDQLSQAKHGFVASEALGDPAVQGALGRLAVEGFNANRDDVDQLIKAAVDVMNYSLGGRKAPAVPLEIAATQA